MWIVSGAAATLSDYVVMVAFMSRSFVDEAFIIYGQGGGLLQACLIMNEEVDVASWFPTYTATHFDDGDSALDQPLNIEACLLMGMSSSDLVHTKNLANTRSRLCKRLGLTMADTSVVIEE
jgi:hypothetical protein